MSLQLGIYFIAPRASYFRGLSTCRPSNLALSPNPRTNPRTNPRLLAVSCPALHRLDLLYQYDNLDMLADVKVKDEFVCTMSK